MSVDTMYAEEEGYKAGFNKLKSDVIDDLDDILLRYSSRKTVDVKELYALRHKLMLEDYNAHYGDWDSSNV